MRILKIIGCHVTMHVVGGSTSSTASISGSITSEGDPYLERALARAANLRKQSTFSQMPDNYGDFVQGLKLALDKWDDSGIATPAMGYALGENRFLAQLPSLMHAFFKKNGYLPNLIEIAYIDSSLCDRISALRAEATRQRAAVASDLRSHDGFIYGNGGKISISRGSWDIFSSYTDCHTHYNGQLVNSPTDYHHRIDSMNVLCITDPEFLVNYYPPTVTYYPDVVVTDTRVTITCSTKTRSGIFTTKKHLGEYSESRNSRLANYLGISGSYKDGKLQFPERARHVCQALAEAFRVYSEAITGVEHNPNKLVVEQIPSPPSTIETHAFFHPDYKEEIEVVLRQDGKQHEEDR